MLVIAKRDFRNPGRQLSLQGAKPDVPHEGLLHPDHIHMGAVIQFGPKPETPLKELKPSERELIGQLAGADCISDATDKKVVAEIKAAVEERDAREERHRAKFVAAQVTATPKGK